MFYSEFPRLRRDTGTIAAPFNCRRPQNESPHIKTLNVQRIGLVASLDPKDVSGIPCIQGSHDSVSLQAVLCAKRISVIICADSKENQIDGDAVIEILQNRLSLDFYFQAFAVVTSISPFKC